MHYENWKQRVTTVKKQEEKKEPEDRTTYKTRKSKGKNAKVKV